MRKILALVGLAAIASAAMAQLSSPFAISWSTYKSGAFSQVKTFKTFTMRSQSDFQTYWATSTGNPATTAPNDIDWLKYEVLAIHLGERKSGGYTVSVRDIQMVRGDEYNVQVVEQIPPRKGIVTESITSPFTIILLPRRYAKYNIAKTIEEQNDWNQGGGWRDRDRGHGGGSGGHGDRDNDRDDGRREGYRLIERGGLSIGPRQMKMDVLRTQREWDRFWSRTEETSRITVYGRSRSNEIDWDRNQVLVLQAGPLETGMTMEVSRVKKTADGFQVYVVQRMPGIRSANLRVSYPYFAIEVPGHSGKFDITVSTTYGQ